MSSDVACVSWMFRLCLRVSCTGCCVRLLALQLDSAKAQLDKQQERWDRVLTPLVSTGVREIMSLDREDVYGLLIDVINVDPAFYTALEVSGGKQLFSMLVEDEKVAKTCIETLQRSRKGEPAVFCVYVFVLVLV